MERLTAALFRLLVSAFGRLSLNGQRRLARLIARVMHWSGSDTAGVTAINIDACFADRSPQERRALVADSLAHSAMLLTELGTLSKWEPAAWRELAVSVEGAQTLEDALAGGSGVLVLVPHFGNWEFLALVLGEYGVTALYDPPRQRVLAEVIHGARSRAGATMLPIDAQGLRRFYHALANGALGALLPDQVPERRAGVYADFFGRPALTMTFAHRLLRRTRARVLMGSATRAPGGFAVRFSDPGPALADPDPQVATRALNAAIEQLVRTDPAQYQWEYKRFKRPPPGTPDLYPRKRRQSARG
ncbi:MAG: lipid A biosynthesis acyltransferase [Gammaproteobacteria bacterium]|jgi:KDO2-lipid IV(A) lauroyltransferase|nr:lipid A biosynthesis acyltransferase [Gammaproteobacteria bacterium]